MEGAHVLKALMVPKWVMLKLYKWELQHAFLYIYYLLLLSPVKLFFLRSQQRKTFFVGMLFTLREVSSDIRMYLTL